MLKMAIFFTLSVEIKKKTYISYVSMYMYVKIAQNGLRIKSNWSTSVGWGERSVKHHSPLLLWYLRLNCFHSFLGDLRRLEIAFEIYWPLAVPNCQQKPEWSENLTFKVSYSWGQIFEEQVNKYHMLLKKSFQPIEHLLVASSIPFFFKSLTFCRTLEV
jgi:hypothetical protein